MWSKSLSVMWMQEKCTRKLITKQMRRNQILWQVSSLAIFLVYIAGKKYKCSSEKIVLGKMCGVWYFPIVLYGLFIL